MPTLLRRRSVRLVLASYAVALSMIGAATVAIHHRGSLSAARHDRLGEIINVAGRQRMLSQRIAYLRRVIGARDGAGAGAAQAEYAAALDAFVAGHDRLTRGDLAWRVDHPHRDALRALYYEDGLDRDVRAYAARAALFAEAVAGTSAGAADVLPAKPDALLDRLDRAVFLHERAAQDIVDEGRAFAVRATAIVLALLLLEAGLVAWPTARRLARVEDELTTLAATDPLTGVRNRRSVLEAARGLLGLAVRSRRPLAVVVLDIDNFKRVNDRHGHAVGDEAIRHVVDLARDAIRESDLIGRIGGEEFVIVCPETSPGGAARVAEKVRRAIAASPVPAANGRLPLTVSLGVHATLPRRGETVEDMMAAADTALYEAKRTGRNRVVSTAPPAAAPGAPDWGADEVGLPPREHRGIVTT